jgi:hypothetical protein
MQFVDETEADLLKLIESDFGPQTGPLNDELCRIDTATLKKMYTRSRREACRVVATRGSTCEAAKLISACFTVACRVVRSVR